MRELFAKVHALLRGLYEALYGFVLHSFKSINRKVSSRFPVWRMKEETTEHVHSSVKVFAWVILPLCLAYVLGYQFLLRENVLGPALWGVVVYFYSNFLPDLPFFCRRKKNDANSADLSWYKKYALLLLAPLLVWLLFAGMRVSWRTMETYHNFRSLAVYGAFLFTLGFLGFATLPVSLEELITIIFFQSCGITGFLTHLKVDKIW